jgi:ribosome biogenesis protein Tsr3
MMHASHAVHVLQLVKAVPIIHTNISTLNYIETAITACMYISGILVSACKEVL